MNNIIILTTLLFFFCAVEGFSLDYSKEKNRMIEEQIISRGVNDKNVISAMQKVERHLFVPDNLRQQAYEDGPLPIGYGQTISQPYIVAYMTEALELKPEDIVLEIGTGSGYQAAVLAEIVKQVYTIELLRPLADGARERLKKSGYSNIEVKQGDGYLGWPEHAPFDKIIVTAAPEDIPIKLIEQLKVGGKMILPVGSFYQELYLITKTDGGFIKKMLLPVRFVPMIKER
ncbi:MAG: protein-L-isoaspartate(D-aspartate) O-methyltransferase [Candidatus Omnitrophica bacterium]|nr:protein-L-isoaspartate(D-aspartate) O-methyltransferase [Candidatus Omnitrophota bacterium]MDD5351959.1 protein-L-isoaspartate(D-aspartate) O-methyltransferase [Candidatus Omnitrophota bacterium]MDD5550785.1 protein-L-isoaspartate(D-aspartate) O-methyltransferase [Candidatus Omnitrophota bacterium]